MTAAQQGCEKGRQVNVVWGAGTSVKLAKQLLKWQPSQFAAVLLHPGQCDREGAMRQSGRPASKSAVARLLLHALRLRAHLSRSR